MKKNILNQLLDKFKNNELISIYSDKEFLDNFLVGYVIKHNEKFVLVKNINQYGDFDGYSVLLKENIYLIEFDDKYLKKLKKLIVNNNLINNNSVENLKNISFDKIIEFSKNNQTIITINLTLDREINGFVTDFDDDYITIQNYNEYGEKDGFSILNLLDIERINLFSKELQRLVKYIK